MLVNFVYAILPVEPEIAHLLFKIFERQLITVCN